MERRWRGKVPLERGHSPMDWMRANASVASMTPHAGRGVVPLAEVERHNTAGDAWVVLRGVVYDMTPYLRYHPGGLDSIASVAGTDGTATFDFYHKWVNHAAFLEKCRVGVLDPNDAAAA